MMSDFVLFFFSFFILDARSVDTVSLLFLRSGTVVVLLL